MEREQVDESHIVKALLIEETYKNLYLVGNIIPEDNKRILQGIKIPGSWNTNAFAISQNSFSLEKHKFDPFTVYVWVESSFSVNDFKRDYFGSELVIVFTIENITDISVSELLTKALKEVSWDDHAINISI